MKKSALLIAAALLAPALASAQYDPNNAFGAGKTAKKAAAAAPEPGETAPAPKKSAMDLAIDKAVADPAADLDKAGIDPRVRLGIKARVGSALGALAALRSSLMIYYGDTEGEFPPDLQTLIPKYEQAIPQIQIPGYPRTNKVTVVKSFKGNEIRKAVRNTGGWLYIADKTSKNFGELYIDSVKLYKDQPLYKK